jgi:hypothetical protein
VVGTAWGVWRSPSDALLQCALDVHATPPTPPTPPTSPTSPTPPTPPTSPTSPTSPAGAVLAILSPCVPLADAQRRARPSNRHNSSRRCDAPPAPQPTWEQASWLAGCAVALPTCPSDAHPAQCQLHLPCCAAPDAALDIVTPTTLAGSRRSRLTNHTRTTTLTVSPGDLSGQVPGSCETAVTDVSPPGVCYVAGGVARTQRTTRSSCLTCSVRRTAASWRQQGEHRAMAHEPTCLPARTSAQSQACAVCGVRCAWWVLL